MKNNMLRAALAVFPIGLTLGIHLGCSARQPQTAWAPPPPRPMLTSARDRQITLFGELPTRDLGQYQSRAQHSLTRHTFVEEGADYDPDLDSTGRRMAFCSTRHSRSPDLYVKATDGLAVTQLTSDPSSDVQPAFSPDDRRIAFASDRSGNWDIWVIDVDGSQPVQVTGGASHDIHPSWSPDGRQLVYCSQPVGGGQWELWVVDAVAGGQRTFIGYGVFPEWSPAGETILYQRARERGSRWFSVWTVTLVNGEPRHPTEIAFGADYAMILPTWSPDGTRIAYTAVASAVPGPVGSGSPDLADIWVVDADGSSRVRLTDGFDANHGPVISADGRVYFTSNREGHENIWSLALPAASPAPAGGKIAASPAEPDSDVRANAPVKVTSTRGDDGR